MSSRAGSCETGIRWLKFNAVGAGGIVVNLRYWRYLNLGCG